MSDFSLILWQFGVWAGITALTCAFTAIPIISNKLGDDGATIMFSVFEILAAVLIMALISFWAQSFFAYAFYAVLAVILLIFLNTGFLELFHSKAMAKAGPAAMALLFPLMILGVGLTLAGIIRLVLGASRSILSFFH